MCIYICTCTYVNTKADLFLSERERERGLRERQRERERISNKIQPTFILLLQIFLSLKHLVMFSLIRVSSSLVLKMVVPGKN